MNPRPRTALGRALASCFVLSGCATVTGPDGEYTVLSASSAIAKALDQCSRPAPTAQATWLPTPEVIARLNEDLPQLHRRKARLCCLRGARLTHPKSYYRQYMGVVVAGKRLIYINAFHDSPPPPAWHQEAVVFCDGGIDWGVLYDPATRRFTDLAFNGVA